MTIIDEPAIETPDHGTPPVWGEPSAHVTIDGVAVMVPPGTSVENFRAFGAASRELMKEKGT